MTPTEGPNDHTSGESHGPVITLHNVPDRATVSGVIRLTIGPEQPGDERSIAAIHAVAFSDGGRRSSAGEVRLVEELRGSGAWVPALSLVARFEEKAIGHLLFSRARIETSSGQIEVLALAPVGVLPGYESTFAGTRLMRAGLAEARRLGFSAVIVLGHPKYYRRFGFRPAGPMGIRAPFPVPEAAWMALELTPGALAGVSGTVRYPPAFDAVS
jgi:putative acetyltransferase